MLFLLLKRILSALIGIPLLIILIYEGKYLFLSGIILFTLVGIYELHKLLCRMKLRVPPVLMFGSSIFFPVLIYFLPSIQQAVIFYIALTCFLLLHLVVMIVSYPKYSVSDIAVSFLGSSYIGILASYLILIRNINQSGFYLLLYVLILTWAYDTGAYFSGNLLGRQPLCPRLSPQKTMEGTAGGLLITVIAALLFQKAYPLFTYFDAIVLGLLIGIFVQVGDLVESAFKRMADVKDSGFIIPGHGGILDRFDGLLFSAPVAYFYLKLVLFR